MRVTVHVPSVDDVAAARDKAEATMREGDELEIIVGQPIARPAERQEARPAGGTPANMGGA